MVLIDFRCLSCGQIFERSNRDYSRECPPPCPDCHLDSERYYPPPAARTNPDPVVVYRTEDGTYRFPGDINGPGAAHYAKLGYERVELRGAAEVRRFERAMNKQEFSRAMRQAELKQQYREQGESMRRSELRSKMASMSRFGRDCARVAMQRGDQRPREYAKEAGFYSEVYSVDRSNRD